MIEETPVLIAGGALAGLSSAAFLARLGHRCLLVERHPSISTQPRFRGPTVRSMELLRSLDLERRVQQVGVRGGGIGGVAWVTDSLSDEEVRWNVEPWEEDLTQFSPTDAYACDQDVFEPILLARARELGADIRFGTELVSFEQDADGVTALIRSRDGGAEHTVRARYLIAGDGSRSPIRERLAIGRRGPGVLGHRMSIYFDTELSPVLDGRPFSACFIESLGGSLLPRDSGCWQLSVPYHPERGESQADFTPDRCTALVHAVLGRDLGRIRLSSLSPWELALAVAERFRDGRTFLVGDAAHVMPPTGGFGGNLAIQDAHNLAWKLDAVLRGAAGPGLLDTYEAERRPVAQLTVTATAERLPRSWLGPDGPQLVGEGSAPAAGGPSHQATDHNTVSLGYRYHSSAVVEDATEPGTASEVTGSATDRSSCEDPRQPTGRPGTRAPHVPLEFDGRSLSTLDLWDRNFVLLTGERGSVWQQAGETVSARLGLSLAVHRIGRSGEADLLDLEGHWPDRYGVGEEGSVLVRPDGFVAWRSLGAPEQPVRALSEALTTVLSRGA